MDAQTLLLESLTLRWKTYKAELKKCRDEFSEESVHDFRVATRRLLSFLVMLRTFMQDDAIQKMRRALKNQLDNLDDLRDTQTLLADISEALRDTQSLLPFQDYLKHEEKKLLRAARRDIKSLELAKLSKRVRKLQRLLETFDNAGLDEKLFTAVDEAYAVIKQRYALVDPGEPPTIHRLRIAFKKFRYMIEVIHPLLQKAPEDYLKRMHDYQSAMGDIQDMEVALQTLADFEEQASAAYDPETVRSYYRERHALAISRYIEDKGEVFTFWRSTPDKSFPEEKTL